MYCLFAICFLTLLLTLPALASDVEASTTAAHALQGRPIRTGSLRLSRNVPSLAHASRSFNDGLTDTQRRSLTSLSDLQYAAASGIVGLEHGGKHIVAGTKGLVRSLKNARQASKEGKHGLATLHVACATCKPVAAVAAACISTAAGVTSAVGFGLKATGDLMAIPFDRLRHRRLRVDPIRSSRHEVKNLAHVMSYDDKPERLLRGMEGVHKSFDRLLIGKKAEFESQGTTSDHAALAHPTPITHDDVNSASFTYRIEGLDR